MQQNLRFTEVWPTQQTNRLKYNFKRFFHACWTNIYVRVYVICFLCVFGPGGAYKCIKYS